MVEVKEAVSFWSNPITLIAAGAIIGFIPTATKDFIGYFVQSKKTKNELSLKRLDELFILISKNANTIRKTLSTILSNAPVKDEFDDTGARMGFIVRVYFPSIFPQYQAYVKQAGLFTFYQIALSQKISKDELLNIQNTKEFQEKHKTFETLYGELCTLIVEEAKKYE